jgi:hypothetical protein
MYKRYRTLKVPKISSQPAYSYPTQTDWFSETLGKLSNHLILVFGLILLLMLMLSIACDQVLTNPDAGSLNGEISVRRSLN